MEGRKNKQLGVLLGIAGVVLFSSKAIFAKKIYAFDTDALDIIALRMWFALPFYMIFLFLDRKEICRITRKDGFSVVVMGIIGYYLASYFDFSGLTYISASLERLILFTYPTFVVVFGLFLFKRSVSKKQVLAILITYIGVLIIFSPYMKVNNITDDLLTGLVFKGGFFVFLSAICYALFLAWSQDVMSRISVRLFTTLSMIVSTICIMVHYTISGQHDLLNLDSEVYGYGFTIAIIATLLPSYFISASVKKIGASQLSIIGALGPVSTISLAYLFLGEQLSLVQGLGAFVIIIGVFGVKK